MSEQLTFSDYAAAEKWLLSITDFERLLGSPAVRYDTQTFDLESFRAQLSDLGDPHLSYGVVHVAGTKGKGSTCAFLESAFRACGLKTGLYTSPHLERFTERVRVNGCEIPDCDFARLIAEMGGRMASAGGSATEGTPGGFRTVFEILTAAAFQYFAEQRVDVAIIETGLGGRLDSTNMFDGSARPLVNVITAIGLDHVSILGDSIAAIAGEKAGIVRRHSRVVVAPQTDRATAEAVKTVVTARCRAVGAAAPVFADDVINIESTKLDCWRYKWQKGDVGAQGETAISELGDGLANGLSICPGLHGEHQAQNVSAALAALIAYEDQARRLTDPGFALSTAEVIAGLESTIWPGRFQELESGGVQYVVDGAHCAISATALGRACRQHFADKPAVVVVGFLRDKAGEEILDGVFEQVPVQFAVGVVPPTPRAISGDRIENALLERLSPEQMTMAPDVEAAICRAQDIACKSGAYVVIYGSLYLVGPALKVL